MKARYIGNPNLTVGKVYDVKVDPDNKYLYDLLPDGGGNCLTCVSMDHFEIIPEEPEYRWCVCVMDTDFEPEFLNYRKGDILQVIFSGNHYYAFDEKEKMPWSGRPLGTIWFAECGSYFRLLTDAEYAELTAQPDEWMV